MGKKRVATGGRRANVVKSQRAASLRPFYVALGVVAVVGAAFIVYSARRSAAERPQITTATTANVQAEGHLLGNPNAPVHVLEFADFECPHCAEFATVTEPDVRSRIIATGLASYRYFDFPLEHFQNSVPASLAASCAGDQGKFWEMHDHLFQGQLDWNSEATSNPKKVFLGYAKAIGLDTGAWETCYDSQRDLPQIMANRNEGLRRKVESTPTFVIGNRQIPGALPYDQFKAYVDSAAADAAAHGATVGSADSAHDAAAAPRQGQGAKQ